MGLAGTRRTAPEWNTRWESTSRANALVILESRWLRWVQPLCFRRPNSFALHKAVSAPPDGNSFVKSVAIFVVPLLPGVCVQSMGYIIVDSSHHLGSWLNCLSSCPAWPSLSGITTSQLQRSYNLYIALCLGRHVSCYPSTVPLSTNKVHYGLRDSFTLNPLEQLNTRRRWAHRGKKPRLAQRHLDCGKHDTLTGSVCFSSVRTWTLGERHHFPCPCQGIDNRY